MKGNKFIYLLLAVSVFSGSFYTSQVRGEPIVLTPEDFVPSYEVEKPTTQSFEKETEDIDIPDFPPPPKEVTKEVTEPTTTKEEETPKEEEIKPTYDISRVDIQDRWWFYHDKTIAQEDRAKLETYKGALSEVINDSSVENKIKEFSKYLFDFNSKNYKDEKQIKEHAQNLKLLYNKPIEQIENGLKSKAVSKVVCASAEPAFFCTYKNGEQMISYTIIKRYKPTETPENKYGRYLVKFVVQNNMVQEYEILEEVLEENRTFDTSEILLINNTGNINERMIQDISELPEIDIMDLQYISNKCLYIGTPVSQEVANAISELIKDFYLVAVGEDCRNEISESQREYTILRLMSFGYSRIDSEKIVDSGIKRKKAKVCSPGLTSQEHIFYSSEDIDTIIAFVYSIEYVADDDWSDNKYAFKVDEVHLQKDESCIYGYSIKRVINKLFG